MKFWKMNGAGNDFIVIDNFVEKIPHECLPEIARTVCERHLSIGADGLMVIDKADIPDADYKMLFYNSDGSIGEMCGNGARCVCRFGYETGHADENPRVQTTAGVITAQRITESEYKVHLNDASVIDLHRKVSVLGTDYECAYVELGSPGVPHAVLYYPGLETADETKLRIIGAALRCNAAFPKGANVNFYDFADDGIFIKTYERGVEDFTYACGTGTGSTALVLMLEGKTEPGETIFRMRGGKLKIEIDMRDGNDQNIWLTGPTNIVCKGEITDSNLCTV